MNVFGRTVGGIGRASGFKGINRNTWVDTMRVSLGLPENKLIPSSSDGIAHMGRQFLGSEHLHNRNREGERRDDVEQKVGA